MTNQRRPRADEAPPVVAVVNTNDDLVQLLREELLKAGFNVVTGHIRDIKAGLLDFSAFLSSHDPQVVVYDIAIPYEDNWTFLTMLRKLPEAQSRRFVVTTVNKQAFEKRVGPTGAIEIRGGRADDLDPIVEAVQKMLKVER